jgi:N4-gp56 family major capsid protein
MGTVSTTSGTYLGDLFDPQVIGDRIRNKLFDKSVFAPLATRYNTLVGRPGSTVSLPYFGKIALAQVVSEGTDIPIYKMTEDTKEVQIKKFGIGIQVTDESILSGYGDVVSEGIDQMIASLGAAVDNDVLAVMAAQAAAEMTTDAGAISADAIAEALTLYGEDIDGPKVLLVDPLGYQTIRKANGWIPGTEIGAAMIVRGTVGMIHGCQVVVSNKLATANCSYIVKPGSLALYYKRDILVERDRDIINKSNVVTADVHLASYLLKPTGLIKMPGASST